MGIEFKYPFLLFLFIPAVFLIFLFLRHGKTKRQEEAWWIAGLRMTVFSLLIFALSVPQILLPAQGETVIFLADRSASVGNSETDALEWIETSVRHKQKNDKFAVIGFGEDVSLEQNLSARQEMVSEFSGKVNETETNLEGSILFASSLIPKNAGGRIVLFSDGNETVGNSLETAKILKNRNIELDHVLLKSPEYEDLSLAEMNVPPSLYMGEEAPVSITVTSNTSKNAVIRLSVNNKEVLKETVQVKEGKNVYTFAHLADTAGLSVYKGEISAENDKFIENNVLYSVANVKGTPKVLIVQEKESGSIGSILDSSGLDTETISPEKLPTVLSGFLQYQSIIFNNVPATVVTENQMNIIEKAVKEFGVGFVMAGGEESFGLGGYFKTPIERLMPVYMDIKGKKEMPSLGLIIVMDRSGSMAGNKLELAKEAAARSVELMREEDTLGFIAFDDRPWEIVPTEPLKDKEKTVEKIRSITPGGGTEIFSSLEKAFQELEGLKLQRKHIILLTDGQSAAGGDYDSLIESGKEKNITLSTVALGTDADRGLLEELAEMGSGRFYDVTDSSVIPSILSRETVMATRTYIENHPFFPSVQPYPEWSQLFLKGVPEMNAYIATTAKSRAQVPLLSEKDDPVLAEWQYGMGRTIAFTSDFSGKWSGDWARWEKWPLFINQLVTKTLPKFESEPFRISLDKKDGNTLVTLKSAKNQSLPLKAAIVAENGEQIKTNTKLVAPGKYEIMMPNSPGMFFLSIKQTDQTGQIQTFQTGFTVPYSEEYLQKGANEELLQTLSKMTEGNALSKEEDAFRPLLKKTQKEQPISEWLILTAFLLFFAEIAIRRFGLILQLGKYIKRNSQLKEEKNDRAEKIKKLKAVNAKGESRIKATDKENGDSSPVTEPIKEVKMKKPQKQMDKATPEEREEKMKRLLEAKRRKNK